MPCQCCPGSPAPAQGQPERDCPDALMRGMKITPPLHNAMHCIISAHLFLPPRRPFLGCVPSPLYWPERLTTRCSPVRDIHTVALECTFAGHSLHARQQAGFWAKHIVNPSARYPEGLKTQLWPLLLYVQPQLREVPELLVNSEDRTVVGTSHDLPPQTPRMAKLGDVVSVTSLFGSGPPLLPYLPPSEAELPVSTHSVQQRPSGQAHCSLLTS